MMATSQTIEKGPPGGSERSSRIFYGWWIVVAAFLNLFFSVGVIFYGFPVFYPAFTAGLGFARGQVTQGFLLGFLFLGLPCGVLTGAFIDRIGARRVILSGIGLIGVPLILMGQMHKLWQYEVLCLLEVVGYTLSGPISNQVLVSRWFHMRRGRAMGYAYLGLGLGGVVAPPVMNLLILHFGWRHALEATGTLILVVLFPVGLWLTRSGPEDMGLRPDGLAAAHDSGAAQGASWSISAAIRTRNFWLIVAGPLLVIGAINTVIQHFIYFMKDQGYSSTTAARYMSILLASSLGGRVLVGYIADHFKKKNTMALFYLLLAASIPILYLAQRPVAALSFAVIFGFCMGADYMLIPLVAAECFGIGSLGKLLALIIMGYTIGQWLAPWIAGRYFDIYQSYHWVWTGLAVAGMLGAAAIYAISVPSATLNLERPEVQ
ncbi:MAG TPA: MFS transporter [Acidobacteriaceae bacterium]|nr:MFS transporter [Acidobacteriaceae bacterium]